MYPVQPVGVHSQLALVDNRPVERLNLPARFNHDRGHVGGGEVIKVPPAHNDGEIDEGVFKSGKSVVRVHELSFQMAHWR
jgi:hypothetical protein